MNTINYPIHPASFLDDSPNQSEVSQDEAYAKLGELVRYMVYMGYSPGEFRARASEYWLKYSDEMVNQAWK